MPDLSLNNIIDSIWNDQNKDERLELPVNLWRPITHEDIEYVCNYYYPFLQILNTSNNIEQDSINPSFILLPNNWVVYDYKNALTTAVPHFYRKEIHGKPKTDSDEEDSSSGEGTIIKQQFDAAFEIMGIVKDRGWSTLEIVDGTSLMKFYAWIAAQVLGISLQGFTPSEAERKRYLVIDREIKLAEEERKLRKTQNLDSTQQ